MARPLRPPLNGPAIKRIIYFLAASLMKREENLFWYALNVYSMQDIFIGF